ncbi:MAG: cyclic nucleotide-binding domain-containing protein, partial [Anaerolineae bacterium]|nr:cyclic nucleotide-binding domain-containing protein [Anaerolineae bacterium]
MKTPSSPIDFSFAFQDLPPVVLQNLADCASVIRLEPREVLFHQGDPAQYIYLVQSGVLRLIEHSTSGQDVSLQIFGRGDVMGIFTIAGMNPLPGRVEALEESLIFAIHRDPFLNLLNQHPELSLTVIKLLI